MNKDIKHRKHMGGSGVERVVCSGSSGIEYLFYFLPDTNGRAYVVMVRHRNYNLYTACSVRIMNKDTGYNEVRYNENSIDSYLHRFEFDGLETDVTYTIRMSWITETEAVYQDIERTYYCSNATPSAAPSVDSEGYTTVPLHESYPRYCLNIECSENSENQDGRCPYDKETRNLFWRVCATNYETHPIASAMEFQNTIRWPSGTVYVAVNYMDNTWVDYTNNCNEIYERIKEWISWMNSLTGQCGVHFELGYTTEKNGRQITVLVGTHKQLWGYNPDESQSESYVYGGTWESVSWGDGIIESRVKICCESRYPWNYCTPAFEGIVFEELTEASGPRYDQFGLNNTVFSEFSYPSKTIGGPEGESWKRDENVIKILYSLGYLKGETVGSNEKSEYGSGITFNKYYDSYGPLSSSGYDLFFEINATKGSIVSPFDYVLPDDVYPYYKSQRTYSLTATYATEVPAARKEEIDGQSFRYSNPSESVTAEFNLPKQPICESSTKIDGGYKIAVSGLSNSGERYQVEAWLKNIADEDVDNKEYRKYVTKAFSTRNISITGLRYGTAYKLYLYAKYGGIHSDWIYIGEGTVAPMKPIVDNLRNTDTSVSFSYNMNGTVFDEVRYELHRDGTSVKNGSSITDFADVTMEFEKITGRYELKIYSVVGANGVDVQCVDSEGGLSCETYTFVISERTKFYWSEAVEKGKPVNGVDYTEWNAFVQNIRDTVCIYAGKDGTMPSNASIYASGFGLAAGESYSIALMNYAMMSETNGTLSAEKFNIVNYVINQCVATDIQYKYKKSEQLVEVKADELIQLQNKINSI